MVSRCLHDGCNHQFGSALQLRAHLFSHAPGLEEEMKLMRETMFNLISILQNWDVKSGADQVCLGHQDQSPCSCSVRI